MNVRITSVSERTRDWSDKRGNDNRSYYVHIEGDEREFEIAQRVTTKPPEVGDEFEATVESREHNGNTYFKLKKAQAQGGGSGVARQDREYGWKTNPEDAARMGRAHAQHMAILAATSAGYFQGEITQQKLDDDLKPLIDWFHADTQNASQAAGASTPARQEGDNGRPQGSPSGSGSATLSVGKAKSLAIEHRWTNEEKRHLLEYFGAERLEDIDPKWATVLYRILAREVPIPGRDSDVPADAAGLPTTASTGSEVTF